MAAIDIFNNNAFGMTSITAALNNVPFQPTRLGELNIFTPKPVRTTSVSVEEKNGALSLISTTPRGAPLDEKAREKRKIRDFRKRRQNQKGDEDLDADLLETRDGGVDKCIDENDDGPRKAEENGEGAEQEHQNEQGQSTNLQGCQIIFSSSSPRA